MITDEGFWDSQIYYTQEKERNARYMIPHVTLIRPEDIDRMAKPKVIGTIEAGKKTDLVVLGQNIFTCLAQEIADTPVKMTIFNGSLVYCRERE